MRSPITRHRFTRITATAALLALAAPSAFAQRINIDVGEDITVGSFGIPTVAYGAGAAQAGTWNGLTDGVAGFGFPADTTPWYVGTNLLDTVGVATTADCVALTNAASSGTGDFVFNNGGTTIDDQALMDDCCDSGASGSTIDWTFSSLTNGTYNVYTYAWAPDSGTFLSSVSVPGSSSTNPQICGGAWPGVQTLGITFTKHTVVVAAGAIVVNVATSSGFGSVNGFQLELLPPPPPASVPFCFGDGSGTQCPCGNNSPAGMGRGCENSNPAHDGCLLTATGSNSVSLDALSLTASGMMDGSYCIFLQGTATEGGGLGVVSPFYDGLLCVGGVLRRFGRSSTLGGTTVLAGIAGLGSVPPAGGTRHYQTVYRNSVPWFCPTATLNTSNGLTINWIP